MKNFKARLAGILACLLLFIVPLQADAGWNASPLPAASINTVFGDSTYLNPEWMTKKVTITWNGNTWMTGMDAFKDMPVRLTNNNGAIDCTFLNTAVFQSFFSAINASIASMTTTAGSSGIQITAPEANIHPKRHSAHKKRLLDARLARPDAP